MENRKYSYSKQLNFLILSFLLYILPLHAQKSEFTQRISWEADKNAYEYKVEIKNLENGQLKEFRTEDNFINFTLPSGKYQYRIAVCDFLGRESSVTEWKDFKILKAMQPVFNYLEEKNLISGEELVINLEITELEENSKIELVNLFENKTLKGELVLEKKNGEIVAKKAVFPEAKEGQWVLRVTNQSGLYSESKRILIENKQVVQKRLKDEALALEKKAKEEALALEKQRLEEEKKEKEERLALEKKEKEERLALEKQEKEERLALEKQRLEEEKKLKEAEKKEALAIKNQKKQEEKEEKQKKQLEAKLLREEKKKQETTSFIDLNFQSGLGAFFFLYDKQLSYYHNSNVLIGMDNKISFLPIDFGLSKLGIEVSAFGSLLYKDTEYYKRTSPVILTRENVIYHYNLGGSNFNIGLKAGPGLCFINSKVIYKENNDPDYGWYGFFSLNAGASLYILPKEKFSIELGADFTHIFITQMPTGGVNIYLNFGVRL